MGNPNIYKLPKLIKNSKINIFSKLKKKKITFLCYTFVPACNMLRENSKLLESTVSGVCSVRMLTM